MPAKYTGTDSMNMERLAKSSGKANSVDSSTTDPIMPTDSFAIEARHISKSYGHVSALTDVSFGVGVGEIVGLLGDNGAGKSTLVKCLSGIIQPDTGIVAISGAEVVLRDAAQARSLGIDTIFQELALVGQLDVTANLFLNREIVSTSRVLRVLGWLDERAMRTQTSTILSRLDITLPSVVAPVDTLSGGERQAVAIGRAVAWGRRVVLMDEPAAALGVKQAAKILDLVRNLSQRGVAVVFISHNMEHVMQVCQRAMVLRHGQLVGDVSIERVTQRDLIDLITGATAMEMKSSSIHVTIADRGSFD